MWILQDDTYSNPPLKKMQFLLDKTNLTLLWDFVLFYFFGVVHGGTNSMFILLLLGSKKNGTNGILMVIPLEFCYALGINRPLKWQVNGEKHRPFNDDPPAMEFPSELSD